MIRNVTAASPELSVVISVREGEETIGRDVRRIADHLRGAGLAFEILAVNDGCCDNSLAVLQLLATQIPELRLSGGDATGKAFVRGTAEASGRLVALVEAGRGELPLAALTWAVARLARDKDAVVLRGRCIVAHRLTCLPAIIRAVGRGALFERTFERSARGLALEIVGLRPRSHGLLAPVFRFLAA
jgi:glycosyltransferase involved in cell wall biosynthesis